jgi:hypothetical protein
MLRKFKGTGLDVVILIFIVGLLVWGGSFFHPGVPSSLGYDVRPMPFFALLLKIDALKPVISVLFTFILVLVTSFLIVNFNTSDFFIGERTFLPGLFYILISGIFPGLQVLNPVLPAVVFLIPGLRKIMDSYKVQGTAYSFFSAGLLISIGSLFYCSFIWFGFLLMIGIAILRTGNIKEIILSTLGLITPWFLTFGFLYIAGKDISVLSSDVAYNLFLKDVHYPVPVPTVAGLAVFGIALVISAGNVLRSIGARKVKSRKTFNLLFWIFLISAGILFIFHSVSYEIIWLAGVPASYYLSYWFVFARKKFLPELLFTAIFLVVALIQIMYVA